MTNMYINKNGYRESEVFDFCDHCGEKKHGTFYYKTQTDNEVCCDDCLEQLRGRKKPDDKTMIVNSMSHGEIVVSRETGEWL